MSRLVLWLIASVLFPTVLLADELHDAHELRHAAYQQNWPHWRGPLVNGVAPHANPPIEWSQDQNIHWKVELPGRGSATPIIWGDRIFILTAIEVGEDESDEPVEDPEPQTAQRGPFRIVQPEHEHQFVVLCLDRADGTLLWQHVARQAMPIAGHHGDNNYASGSPCTDGNRLYASFGSYGTYCYDLDGKLLWERDLGDMRTRFSFGETSTPVLHDDRLIVMWDQEDQSHIFVLDAGTGETLWEAERDEPSNWSTPLVVEHDGRKQVVTNGTNRVRSYDLETGELLWECGGQTTNAIPCPVAREGIVYCMSGLRGNAIYAIPLDSSGDVTDSESIVWHRDRAAPYVPSPLLYGDRIFITAGNNAIVSCLDAATGEPLIDRQRLQNIRQFYASPVGAADRVYFVGRDGTCLVMKNAPEYEELATNRLDEPIDASPALVGNQIFLRGEQHLYCIQEP